MKALEHNAQLREAHLTARLTALRTFGTERAINLLPTFSLKGGAPEPEDGVSAETALRAPAGTLIQPAVPQDMCSPPSAAWDTSDLVDEHVAGPQAVKLRTRSVLTISMLLDHYSEASKTACEATPRAYLSELPELFHRMAERGALTKDMKKQRTSDLRLFSLITGVTDAIDITQAHLTYWCDTLGKLPKHFLLSSNDMGHTIDVIIMIARSLLKEQRGLHSETIRRHKKSLELVVERACAEAHPVAKLDFGHLKPKKTSSKLAHGRRSVFRKEEAKTVFAHPVWQGCKSPGRRHDPGSLMMTDALFWIPLTLAYTGARRAEIAGLTVGDFETHDGIPCIGIRSNMFRGIKGDPENYDQDGLTRVVPIHTPGSFRPEATA